jgi:hypothetical protein
MLRAGSRQLLGVCTRSCLRFFFASCSFLVPSGVTRFTQQSLSYPSRFKMALEAISELNGWATLIRKSKELDRYTWAFIPSSHFKGEQKTWVAAEHPVSLLFRDEILPILLSERITTHDQHLKELYPWLAEFQPWSPEQYPLSFELFRRDPNEMLEVFVAYATLLDFMMVQKSVAAFTRQWIDRFIDGLENPPQSQLSLKSGKLTAELESSANLEMSTMNGKTHLRDQYEALLKITDDDSFLKNFASIDLGRAYTNFVAIWKFGAYEANSGATWERNEIRSSIKHFANLLPPADNVTSTDVFDSIYAIRTKSLTQISESRERQMDAQIELLQKEKRELEDRMRRYDRAISDLGFRHLTEKLPIRGGVGGSTSTDRWRNFWAKAWNYGGNGPKAGSPLRPLWDNNSAAPNRSSIRDAGDALFGVLSANIHGFGLVYDPQASQRDKHPGEILAALKPMHFTGHEVDWTQEVARFV